MPKIIIKRELVKLCHINRSSLFFRHRVYLLFYLLLIVLQPCSAAAAASRTVSVYRVCDSHHIIASVIVFH